MKRFENNLRTDRRGFTLLEILIVVSLIAVLAAFLTMAIGRSITQAKEVATRTTLLKIDGLLQQRLEALGNLLATPQRKSEVSLRIAENGPKDKELDSASVPALGTEARRLLTYKDYLRLSFPQTLADNRGLGAASQYFAGNLQNRAESAECLYWIITQADNFGVEPVGESEFTSSEVADTDGDGRLEFVDAWRLPLMFYRWPTRLIRAAQPNVWTSSNPTPAVNRAVAGLLFSGLPATGSPDPLQRDPDDRLGLFSTQIVSKGISPLQYESLYLSGTAPSYSQAPTTPAPASASDTGYFATHTGDTYHLPLIVSGGADKDVGLYEPWDCANFGRLAQPRSDVMADPLNSALNDNLTNRQKQKQ